MRSCSRCAEVPPPRPDERSPLRSARLFYNAHAIGTADRHAAAAIDYAGGAPWADGTTNPAATVEAQIDEIVADLATACGAAKIGAAATAGTPGALGAGSIKSQLDALLELLNGHATASAAAHTASAIAYAGGGAWKDGTASPATTVEAQLDKLVGDLSADAGAARLGAGARTGWLDGRTNPAGVSVLGAFNKIIATSRSKPPMPTVPRGSARAAPVRCPRGPFARSSMR
jgi:hypothetical protein